MGPLKFHCIDLLDRWVGIWCR